MKLIKLENLAKMSLNAKNLHEDSIIFLMYVGVKENILLVMI